MSRYIFDSYSRSFWYPSCFPTKNRVRTLIPSGHSLALPNVSLIIARMSGEVALPCTHMITSGDSKNKIFICYSTYELWLMIYDFMTLWLMVLKIIFMKSNTRCIIQCATVRFISYFIPERWFLCLHFAVTADASI